MKVAPQRLLQTCLNQIFDVAGRQFDAEAQRKQKAGQVFARPAVLFERPYLTRADSSAALDTLAPLSG